MDVLCRLSLGIEGQGLSGCALEGSGESAEAAGILPPSLPLLHPLEFCHRAGFRQAEAGGVALKLQRKLRMGFQLSQIESDNMPIRINLQIYLGLLTYNEAIIIM